MIFGVIGIVRPSIKVSAAAIVDAIGQGFDPLAMFNFAAISWSASSRLASDLAPVPALVFRIASSCAFV